MKIRIAYLLVIALSWQLLPTALVGPGQDPSLKGFLAFGLLYTLGFNAVVWLMGLLRSSLEVVTCTLCAWMMSGFLNYILYFDSQGVRASRSGRITLTHQAPDPTFAFVFLSVTLIVMAEAALWGRRAQVAASVSAVPRSD